MNMQVLEARRDVSGGYKVDVSRGSRVGRVSSEWFSRPDDQRFLSLNDLASSVRGRSERSRTRVVETALIHVEANRNDPERLALMLPGADTPVQPTHWSFGQLASQVGAPAAYLRQLPAPLAAINLQYGLTSNRAEQIKTLETDDGHGGRRVELRAVTGPDYGRIYDHELVEAVQKIAGNGTGDTRWKVPGVLDWSTGVYNPMVDISKDTTTLYASDRDVFLFLVDDLNPIEVGRLPDGSPDLYFRGFYCWNSEAGAKTLGMASFYLRAVCQNRNLWGVEDFEEISIRHSKYAANRFAHEAAPALLNFANSSGPVAAGDTVRWMIGDTVSGIGASARVHILVKPIRPDITTNLVINTDRRTYHLELRANPSVYMASVSWTYPQDQLIALRQARAEAERVAPVAAGLDLSTLNFRYAIEGDRPDWRPLRAFDDGVRVFIEFPGSVAQGDLPPLFVIGTKGEAELVNYRFAGRYMIVDRLFSAAELRLGGRKGQDKVRIVSQRRGRP